MNQQGNDFFPYDDVPDTNVFPGGTFEFEWSNLEDGYSQSSNKRMLKAQFTCVQPANLAGLSFWENYVCGTDQNPAEINAASMGARNLKRAMNAAQVPANNSVAQICNLINQSKPHLMVTLSLYTEKDGQFAGEPRNRAVSYDKLGAKMVQVLTPAGGSGGSGAPVVSGAPVAQGVAPVPQAPPQQMTTPAPMPQPTTPPPVQQPMAPAPQQAPPVQQQAPPTTAQAPAAPAPPTTPAPAAAGSAPATPGQGAPLIPCNICGQNISASQYEAHIMEHVQKGELGQG
jgi:hypothetical protein